MKINFALYIESKELKEHNLEAHLPQHKNVFKDLIKEKATNTIMTTTKYC